MELHIVCTIDKPNGSGNKKAVLAFLFEEDDSVYNIPLVYDTISHLD